MRTSKSLIIFAQRLRSECQERGSWGARVTSKKKDKVPAEIITSLSCSTMWH